MNFISFPINLFSGPGSSPGFHIKCDILISCCPVPASVSYTTVQSCVLSRVQLFVAPWTVARQAPLSMGFSRQEYWSGLPFPPAGDLPNPGTEPISLASPALAGGFLTTSATWEAHICVLTSCIFN